MISKPQKKLDLNPVLYSKFDYHDELFSGLVAP